MPELIAPTVRLHAAWLAAHHEWGPGRHEDGFGLRPADEVVSPAGFAAWVARMADEADRAPDPGGVRCTYRWIVEGDRVLGGIALRHELDDFLLRVGGHIGYGIRPSARRRGLATWALGRMLDEARGLGLDRVLVTCADGNVASARTIERQGGVLEDVRDTELGRARRYWITLQTGPGTTADSTGSNIAGMATRLVQINMKARDDSALGAFWAEVLGWEVSSEGPGVTNLEPEGFVYPDPVAVCIDLVVSPEPKTAKNRVHVDLATTSAAHQAEVVARLKDLGATPADVGQGDVPWTVMADPEGNEFCVLDPSPLHRDTGPIAAVVVDCVDPRAMARFWGEATDWTVHEVTDHEAVLRSAKGVGPYLRFVRTPDVKTGWNRVHLDVRPYPGDDLEAAAARLRTLGATAIDLDQKIHWKVLADPEGNEFCLLTPA